MESIPDSQSAWIVTRRGHPSKVLRLKKDWPVPKELKDGEVLVKVQAAALNPAGWKLMLVVPNWLFKRPHAAEFDLAGVVVASNDPELSPGDNVFGWIPANIQYKTHQGALAQYTSVHGKSVVKRPANITPTEAAGVTLAALTSYQALFKIGKLESEQTVFINGGSSSLGAYAIQFAKAKGARVVATASTKNEAFVRRMGADEFIDYTQVGSLAEYLSLNPPSTKYHIIYDAVGLIDPSLYTFSEKYLAPNGVFVSSGPMPKNFAASEIWKLFRTVGATITPTWLGGTKRRYVVIATKDDHDDLLEIAAMLKSGAIKPVNDSTYNMEDVLTAYERIMSGRAIGKVVVKVDPTTN